VRMHDAPTSGFIEFVTRWVRYGPEPPPRCANSGLLGYELSKTAGWRLCRVRTYRELDQRVRKLIKLLHMQHKSERGVVSMQSRQPAGRHRRTPRPTFAPPYAISGPLSRVTKRHDMSSAGAIPCGGRGCPPREQTDRKRHIPVGPDGHMSPSVSRVPDTLRPHWRGSGHLRVAAIYRAPDQFRY
jgi:hypothetical protein